LVIEFIELLKLINASKYSSIANSHSTVHCSTHYGISLGWLCLHRLSPGNGDQRHRFPSFPVPRLRYSLGCAYLTTQLDVARLQSPNKVCSSRPYGSRTYFLTVDDFRPYCSAPVASKTRPRAFFLRLLTADYSIRRCVATLPPVGTPPSSTSPPGDLSQIRTVSELKFTLGLTVGRPDIVGVKPRLGAKTRLL
jgi:hypothetical protein